MAIKDTNEFWLVDCSPEGLEVWDEDPTLSEQWQSGAITPERVVYVRVVGAPLVIDQVLESLRQMTSEERTSLRQAMAKEFVEFRATVIDETEDILEKFGELRRTLREAIRKASDRAELKRADALESTLLAVIRAQTDLPTGKS